MDDLAAFSAGGTARGAYQPFDPVTTPDPNHPSNHQPVVRHTSDGNVQHSSCDAHGDCAVGHAQSVVASTDASADGPVDPLAGRASSDLPCARDQHSRVRHDQIVHAFESVHPEGVDVVAPSAATPHPLGARLPLVFEGSTEACSHESDMMQRMSTSYSNDSSVTRDENLIDFVTAPSSQLREGATVTPEACSMSMHATVPSPAQSSGVQAMGQTTCNSTCNSTCNAAANLQIEPQMSTAQYVALQESRRDAMRRQRQVLEAELARCDASLAQSRSQSLVTVVPSVGAVSSLKVSPVPFPPLVSTSGVSPPGVASASGVANEIINKSCVRGLVTRNVDQSPSVSSNSEGRSRVTRNADQEDASHCATHTNSLKDCREGNQSTRNAGWNLHPSVSLTPSCVEGGDLTRNVEVASPSLSAEGCSKGVPTRNAGYSPTAAPPLVSPIYEEGRSRR